VKTSSNRQNYHKDKGRLAMIRKDIILLVIFLMGIWLWNSSLFSKPAPDAQTHFIAHRGVHQSFDSSNVSSNDCTATLIENTGHDYIENTAASIKAAFDAGAHVVEIDIQPSLEGVFVLFHDWTLDCRTDGTGEVRKTPLSLLKNLDIGYGYTHDGGKTFPLRTKGIGLMPTLGEIFDAFPDRLFLVNFKSGRRSEGEQFVQFIKNNPHYQRNIWGVYGGNPNPVTAAIEALPGLKGYSRKSIKTCLKNYFLTGWTGILPKPCRSTLIVVPISHAHFLWGWPHKFTNRLSKHQSEVIILGPYTNKNGFSSGIDNENDFSKIPDKINGFIWTNKIQQVTPLLAPKGQN